MLCVAITARLSSVVQRGMKNQVGDLHLVIILVARLQNLRALYACCSLSVQEHSAVGSKIALNLLFDCIGDCIHYFVILFHVSFMTLLQMLCYLFNGFLSETRRLCCLFRPGHFFNLNKDLQVIQKKRKKKEALFVYNYIK